jgi:MFS family permease
VRVLRERIADSLRSLRGVFANPDLRRLELAWAGSNLGGWAYSVGVAVYAYEAGGTTAVGLVAFARMLASALVAPFFGVLADRYRRRAVMVVSDLTRAAALVAAAAGALAHGAPIIVYVMTGIVSLASTAFQPAQSAILPALVHEPEELAAANVASSTIESVAIFAGPALGGLLLAATSPGVVFAATAATFVWSALLVVRITAETKASAEGEGDAANSEDPTRRIMREAITGVTTIARDARLRLLIGLYGAQTFVHGLLNVLLVVIALKLLGLGEGGVGYLNSAVGVGGVIGALFALMLVGRRRLAGTFGLGIVAWGVPIALIGIWANSVAALVFLAVLGIGNTVVDVAALTLLQRAVPGEILGRVFGVLESLILATIGLGSVLAPLLVSLLGVRGALIATGAILPALAALTWRSLVAIDAAVEVPAQEIALLRGVPFLAGLPTPTLERLAEKLEPVALGAGTVVFRQGEEGDRFYVVARGAVEVVAGGRRLASFGEGYYFGEIALLHGVPRTATVTAASDVGLYALERDDFLAAVTGHAPTVEQADAVIGRRLSALRAGVASL